MLADSQLADQGTAGDLKAESLELGREIETLVGQLSEEMREEMGYGGNS